MQFANDNKTCLTMDEIWPWKYRIWSLKYRICAWICTCTMCAWQCAQFVHEFLLIIFFLQSLQLSDSMKSSLLLVTCKCVQSHHNCKHHKAKKNYTYHRLAGWPVTTELLTYKMRLHHITLMDRNSSRDWWFSTDVFPEHISEDVFREHII